jgi:hypothetical protein
MNSWEKDRPDIAKMTTHYLESRPLPFETPELIDALIAELMVTTRAYWLVRVHTEHVESDSWYEAKKHKQRIIDLNRELEKALQVCAHEIRHNREIARLEIRVRAATLLCEVEVTCPDLSNASHSQEGNGR